MRHCGRTSPRQPLPALLPPLHLSSRPDTRTAHAPSTAPPSLLPPVPAAARNGLLCLYLTLRANATESPPHRAPCSLNAPVVVQEHHGDRGRERLPADVHGPEVTEQPALGTAGGARRAGSGRRRRDSEVAGGETSVILLHPALPLSRCFNRHGEAMSAK